MSLNDQGNLSGQPLVTTVVICFNHANYVEELLNSVLGQTYPNIELIIVDSCSTDDSTGIIKRWVDKNQVKCELIEQTSRSASTESLMAAMAVASGKYLQVVSADDVYRRDKTAGQVAIMEELDSNYGLIYSDYAICNENSELVEEDFYSSHSRSTPTGEVYVAQAKNNFVKIGSALIRMEASEQIGHFDKNLSFEDVDYLLRMAEKFKFQYDRSVTFVWRKHSSNLTDSLYDNSDYLDSRLKAYLKHVQKGNVEIDRILFPKIGKLLVLLKRFDPGFDIRLFENAIDRNNIGMLTVLFLRGVLSYKAVVLIRNVQAFLSETKRIIRTPSRLLEPLRFQ